MRNSWKRSPRVFFCLFRLAFPSFFRCFVSHVCFRFLFGNLLLLTLNNIWYLFYKRSIQHSQKVWIWSEKSFLLPISVSQCSQLLCLLLLADCLSNTKKGNLFDRHDSSNNIAKCTKLRKNKRTYWPVVLLWHSVAAQRCGTALEYNIVRQRCGTALLIFINTKLQGTNGSLVPKDKLYFLRSDH